MKINEAEKLLGITKANIRFYEKEGLLTPHRTANGYRDYEDSDILLLKQIIILRKLGFPTALISDILYGALPLQDALEEHIQTLQKEIESLNGSVLLCKQLKQEKSATLDTGRYWDIVILKEQQGFHFQSLIQDYTAFVGERIRGLWYIPDDKKHSKREIIKYTLLHAAFWGILSALLGLGFGKRFLFWISLDLVMPFLLGLCLIPAFLLKRKHPQRGSIFDFLIRLILAVIILYFGMRAIFT